MKQKKNNSRNRYKKYTNTQTHLHKITLDEWHTSIYVRHSTYKNYTNLSLVILFNITFITSFLFKILNVKYKNNTLITITMVESSKFNKKKHEYYNTTQKNNSDNILMFTYCDNTLEIYHCDIILDIEATYNYKKPINKILEMYTHKIIHMIGFDHNSIYEDSLMWGIEGMTLSNITN